MSTSQLFFGGNLRCRFLQNAKCWVETVNVVLPPRTSRKRRPVVQARNRLNKRGTEARLVLERPNMRSPCQHNKHFSEICDVIARFGR